MIEGSIGVVDRGTLTAEPGLGFLLGIIEGRHPAPPFAATSRMVLTEVEDGRVVFEGEPTEAFFNPLGTIHGGWTATMLDSAMACAIHSTLAAGEAYTTVEMKLNYIRPVMPGGRLRCEGRLIHRGGTLATSDGKLTDARGRLLAHGSETCMIFKARG